MRLLGGGWWSLCRLGWCWRRFHRTCGRCSALLRSFGLHAYRGAVCERDRLRDGLGRWSLLGFNLRLARAEPDTQSSSLQPETSHTLSPYCPFLCWQKAQHCRPEHRGRSTVELPSRVAPALPNFSPQHLRGAPSPISALDTATYTSDTLQAAANKPQCRPPRKFALSTAVSCANSPSKHKPRAQRIRSSPPPRRSRNACGNHSNRPQPPRKPIPQVKKHKSSSLSNMCRHKGCMLP